ncbi:DUF6383 domain-containing protein [Parabacteroides sp.]
MNKKSTLLAAALMAVSSFTVSAADITPGSQVSSANWTEGNYYYLRNNAKDYLAISVENQDSVVLVADAVSSKNIADLALWEITYAGTETSSNVYQFVNKKTKKTLSFAKDINGDPVLAEGVDKWSFSESGSGNITAKLSATETMQLCKGTDNKVQFKDGTLMVLTVVAPANNYPMTSKDLGNSFSTFQLSMGETIEGDIFKGKDIIATAKDGYLLLQEKGNEAYDNGVKKYFGLDTLTIEGAEALKTLGYKFSLDSIREETGKVNDFAKLFKFTADLKNDSLTMIVKGIPGNNTDTKDVKVVYAKLDDKKILTVTDPEDDGGIYPFITAQRGTPAEISTKTGVYFLKSASKGEDGGKYYYGNELKSEKPSVNQLDGQWYIKEEGGLYSIVARTGTVTKLSKGEVFAVQGMTNTFTFGTSTDSITVEVQNVNFNDKYLGSLHFSKEELANNGYVLNLIPDGAETSNSYTFTADSILQVKSGEAKDAVIFKLDSVRAEEIGGAKNLKDTVSVVFYKLKSQFGDKYVAYDDVKKSLKLTTEADDALEFRFNTNVNGGKYNMQIVSDNDAVGGKFVNAQVSTSNMVLSETPAYFNFVEMDAPEYGTFESSHKRFTTNAVSLTMNPLNFFAEVRTEEMDLLKAAYAKDNFSLWTIKSEASTADKPLYFITTSLEIDGVPEVDRIRYYMVSGRDSALVDAEGNTRVNFIANDTLETMKDSAKNPALWAFKVTESGNYLLENQQEVNSITQVVKYPYLGIVNNVVVMSKTGAEFAIEGAPAPVANESITDASAVKLIGGVGELTILNAGGKRISISNILGQTINSFVASSDNVNIGAARGVLIVSIEGENAQKVIVK